jgi:hypothetical protein
MCSQKTFRPAHALEVSADIGMRRWHDCMPVTSLKLSHNNSQSSQPEQAADAAAEIYHSKAATAAHVLGEPAAEACHVSTLLAAAQTSPVLQCRECTSTLIHVGHALLVKRCIKV